MTGGPGRMAWIILSSAAAAVMLIAGTLSVANALARDQDTITTSFDGARVRVVDIELTNGSVTLVQSSGGAVTVIARRTQGLHRSEGQVDVVGERLVIRQSCEAPPVPLFCRTDYTVEVPAHVSADLRSRNGSILVSGIDGAVEATSFNGDVAVNQSSGQLRLRSSNGRVGVAAASSDVVEASSRNGEVRLVFADEPREVHAESGNGAVDVVLPHSQAAYRVDASSRHGEVDTTVRTDPDSTRSVVARSRNGSVTVSYPQG